MTLQNYGGVSVWSRKEYKDYTIKRHRDRERGKYAYTYHVRAPDGTELPRDLPYNSYSARSFQKAKRLVNEDIENQREDD